MMLNTYDILEEFTLIRTGFHPKWRGDRIYNGDHFLFDIARKFPACDVDELAIDIYDKSAYWSDKLGAHPDTYKHAANELFKALSHK